MFESLQERLGSILNGLTGRGALSEADVTAALREVRRALLEADVALEVVRSFTDKVREKAVGAAVLKSIKPARWWSRSSMTNWSPCWARKAFPSTSTRRRRSWS